MRTRTLLLVLFLGGNSLNAMGNTDGIIRCEGTVPANTYDLGNGLPPELRSSYSRSAARIGVTTESLLAPLAFAYQQRRYKQAQFIGLLQALDHVVSDETDPLDDSWRGVEPTLGKGERIIFYMNPHCGDCDHALNLILALRETCSGAFPALVIRTAPDPTTASQEAAIALEVIRERMPDKYINATIDFLAVLWRSEASLPALLAKYFGATGGVSPDEHKRIAAALDLERQKLMRRKLYPPLLFYHRRAIQRLELKTGDSFDPFRDSTNLSTTLTLVSAVDTTSSKPVK